MKKRTKGQPRIYDAQTIKLTYSAACGCVMQAFNEGEEDIRTMAITDISRLVLRKLGFKDPVYE